MVISMWEMVLLNHPMTLSLSWKKEELDIHDEVNFLLTISDQINKGKIISQKSVLESDFR